ncbi:MAG TPA: hypothetical protein PLY93_07670 [Turneriella sp.]|nr:hypothetical protein [Turneriella sp.]
MIRGISLYAVSIALSSVMALSPRHQKVDHHGNATENFSARGLRLYASAEKLRFAKNEPIIFTLSLVNEGAYPITIYLHENPLKNFTVIARDPKGKSLNIKEEMYYRGTSDWRDTHFTRYTGETYPMRKMILHVGEKFEKSIRLSDYVEWDTFAADLKKLNVAAYFYPNPLQAERYSIQTAAPLHFLYDQSREVLPEKDNTADASIETPSVSAREIVYLMLSAEFTKNWPQYFKYVSLKDIIRDYPEFARLYADESSQVRAQALGEFRKFLSGRGAHHLLRFRVLSGESSERGDIAEVRVRARRNVEGFERDYLTTYYLTKREALWQVTGVESRLAD